MDTTAPGHEETPSEIVSDVRFGAVTRPKRPIANYHDKHVLCGWLPRCKDFFLRSDLVRYSLVSGLLMRFC